MNRGQTMISKRFCVGNAALMAGLLLLSGCGKPDVYALSMIEAYMRLDAVQI